MSIWIAGAGVVSSFGLGKEKLFQALYQRRIGLNEQGLGYVGDGDRHLIAQELKSKSWPLQMSLWAAREAIHEAGWTHFSPRDGIIFATTTGQIIVWEKELAYLFQHQSESPPFKHHPLGTVLDEFCVSAPEYLGFPQEFTGPRTLIASACAASTQALALASLWIETGKVDRCLVGGAEVLCDLTVEGFRSLKLLSAQPCRPFDQQRAGINLSEGAAFLCLQKDKGSAKAKLLGYGLSSDAYHMTSPHPEGQGAYRAMASALAKAKISEEQIGWVHTHGTGSINNDLAEGAALKYLLKNHRPFISSTKGSHGHTLGISGVFESVISYQGLCEQTQIATMGLQDLDPQINLSIAKEHAHQPVDIILKNTLGFGGVNASLVLGRV